MLIKAWGYAFQFKRFWDEKLKSYGGFSPESPAVWFQFFVS